MDQPLTSKLLGDASSPQFTIIMLFLSMDPPFYAHLNKAIRMMDAGYLLNLGPFARALSVLMYHSDESDPCRKFPLLKGLNNGK